ncbi:winged helix DNA-binding domain-containing protein [Flavobacterium microcysteis]|uniref:Winged helix DNA-binding domain-containing protein n=1 Tax=Flavobacterium microcysteis TaxID=2596891 RepID=A0A501QI35_9FLAO|nr:winged helix DNA-binding domain-containing protein [Flavobacterium microcysteis]TPD71811.1 winged helix DNA-binding domain-containing protein [Flavobacterium microcysteis]
MTQHDIAKFRLLSQQITKPELKSAPEMVAYFGAIQGQEYAQTKWSLGIRIPHLNDVDIEKDLNEGRILRTHLLRPTWHFVAPEDIRWMLMLTGPRVEAINAYMYRKMELDSTTFNQCNTIMQRALEGGKHLTREALSQEFLKNNIQADGTRLVCIMMKAELEGLICSGARQGNQFTYALLEERVSLVTKKDRDEALAELSQRYFISHGPATAKDFSTWSGLSLTDCKKGIEMVKAQLAEEKIESETYYFSPKLNLDMGSFGQLQLLPVYDEMIMGYKNRDALMQHRNSVQPGKRLRYDNTLLFDGQVIGSWRRKIKPKVIDLEYEFLEQPDKKQESEFEKALLRFEEFYGLTINTINNSK